MINDNTNKQFGFLSHHILNNEKDIYIYVYYVYMKNTYEHYQG